MSLKSAADELITPDVRGTQQITLPPGLGNSSVGCNTFSSIQLSVTFNQKPANHNTHKSFPCF